MPVRRRRRYRGAVDLKTHPAKTSCISFSGEAAMKKMITDFLSDEEGATAIEYGLIAALIGVAIIAAVRAVGTNLGATFSSIESALPG